MQGLNPFGRMTFISYNTQIPWQEFFYSESLPKKNSWSVHWHVRRCLHSYIL